MKNTIRGAGKCQPRCRFRNLLTAAIGRTATGAAEALLRRACALGSVGRYQSEGALQSAHVYPVPHGSRQLGRCRTALRRTVRARGVTGDRHQSRPGDRGATWSQRRSRRAPLFPGGPSSRPDRLGWRPDPTGNAGRTVPNGTGIWDGGMKAGDEIIVITWLHRWQRRLKGWSERRCTSSYSQSPIRISRPFFGGARKRLLSNA